MPATRSNRRCAIRPGPSAASRTLLCLLAFLATGAAVLWLRGSELGQTDRYAATATIWHCEAPSDSVGPFPPTELVSFDPAVIRRRVHAEVNLRRALRQIERQEQKSRPAQGARTPAPARTVEQVRQDLQVAPAEPSAARVGVAISYSDRDPDRAVRLVNALATVCAEQCRADIESRGADDHPEVGEAAERARQEYFEAKGRFDDFIGQHFLKQEALADRVARWEPESPPVEGSPGGRAGGSMAHPRVEAEVATPPPPVDPETADLQRQLAELEERRSLLLATRTPLHPEVQDVELRIAGVRERLASISPAFPAPSIPPNQPEQPPGGAPAGQEPTQGRPVAEDRPSTGEGTPHAPAEHLPAEELAAELAEATRAFRRHQDSLDRAQAEYDRLAEAKRRAWEARISTPSIELELARVGVPCQPADGPSRSVLVALASALAVTFGAGLIWSGFDTDLPLATLAEAEAVVGVPVVGKVPPTSPSTTPKTHSRRRGGLAKIVLGVLLIGVCFGFLAAVL